MINGIEILAQENIMTTTNIIEVLTLVSLSVFLLCVITIFITGIVNNFLAYGSILSGTASMILILLFFFYAPVLDHVEYKVTISDEINFNEFNSKYEIVNQEGKIYTIKERK